MNVFSRFFAKPGPDFPALCEKALDELRDKSIAHEKLWGLGHALRWDLNQEEGKLIFTFHEKIVSCEAQIVGSWNAPNRTWLWAWGNLSVAKELTRTSVRVRAYGLEHGIAKLTTPKWDSDEEEAWRMAAVARSLVKAQGVYRGPVGDVFTFMTFGTPKIERR